MKIILETERLYLREIIPPDAETMWALNADPEVIRYTGDAPFESVESARVFITQYPDYRLNGYGRWAVLEKTSGELLGWCGLKLNEEGLVDIGFRFFKKHWKKGYATESARACLDFGFNELKLKEIIGRADRDNKASIRVMEKLSMKFWKNSPCDGIEDAVYYRISRQNFRNLQRR